MNRVARLQTRPSRRPAPFWANRGRGFWLLSVLEVAVVPVWLSVESPTLQERTAPRPGAHPHLGRATTFARHGISVVFLAIYKGKQERVIGLQKRRIYKGLKISAL